MYACSNCTIRACNPKEHDRFPGKCPGRSDLIAECNSEYLTEENADFARISSEESIKREVSYPRMVEIMRVARRCGYQKLGLAFCMGLMKEASIVSKILKYHGFQVESIVCKVGGIDKDILGIENGGNAMCNPIAQARFLNEQNTEFNIVLGLCVGHDSLFFKYSEAPVTVLAAKDKVLGHNPLAALYLEEGYYHDILYAPLPAADPSDK